MKTGKIALMVAWLSQTIILGDGTFWPLKKTTIGCGKTSCPCGMSNQAKVFQMRSRIVGGSEAGPNEYPWMASLGVELKDRIVHNCGAVVLDQKVLLTAAHCVLPLQDFTLYVTAGTSDLSQPGQRLKVDRFVNHPDYVEGTDPSDLSILFLKEPLQFGQDVGPVCLPSGDERLVGSTVRIIGWGQPDGDSPSGKELRKTDVEVIANCECRKFHPVAPHQIQVCTRTSGKGACFGDSGGPIALFDKETARWLLVAVVSYGGVGCDPELPTVGPKISAYLGWIASTANTTGCHII